MEILTERFIRPEKRAGFESRIKELKALVITPADAKGIPVRAASAGTATGSAIKLENGLLSVKLSGRIDSISAPDVLQAYENTVKGASFTEVKVDAKGLEYISSAGLRVLLMMIKASDEKKMSIDNASPAVCEILEMTGFDNIMAYVKGPVR